MSQLGAIPGDRDRTIEAVASGARGKAARHADRLGLASGEITLTDIFNDPETDRWNHHPGKVQLSPVFAWPPRPLASLRWLSGAWLVLSTTTLALALAVLAYATLLPPLAEMASLAPGWILRLWLANLIPHCVLAGTLHWWLHMRRGQERRTKYDTREQARDNGTFTFRSQVRDNMFWTVASGITLWTAMQALVFCAMANGLAPKAFFPSNPAWFALWFVLIPIWSSLHFYWIHRLLHWPPLYRIAHALHHRNINVGPWSGISMHPVEHLLFYTNFLIHFIVPSHPLHIMFHGYTQSVHPIFSHSGFEKLIVSDRERARMGDFFHQLHHRYFECNYGTVDMPWDRWFGSFHDGTAKATETTRNRKSRMHARA